MTAPEQPVRLTQYSHGAGCGCKIAPKVLDEILKDQFQPIDTTPLLVGNQSKDDAAVFDLGNGTAVISTTDFFMPIVDDPFDFGRIAAANAISDVYAMGGRPLMAIAVLGWPVAQLPLEWAQRILKGGRQICGEAGIPLAGGHSIDTTEPIFGLAVTGIVPIPHLKRNNTAAEGDLLFLTKPLGVGVLSTAMKRGVLNEEYLPTLISNMSALNTCGAALGSLEGVRAMTDVTGFGLLGHLLEMAEGSGLQAEIQYAAIPVLEGVSELIARRVFPDATTRNWSSYGSKIKFEKGVNVMEAFTLLPDPQTNGGLLVAVAPWAVDSFVKVLQAHGLEAFTTPIGSMVRGAETPVRVKP